LILREDGGVENTCSTDDGKPEWKILASCFCVTVKINHLLCRWREYLQIKATPVLN
jgi:hypothetical protein